MQRTRPALASIAEVLTYHAENRPDHPAVEEAERVVTYAELLGLANTAAANLSDLGIRAGDIVGVMLPDTPEHLAVLAALEMTGAVTLSLNGTVPSSEKKKAVKGLDVKAVITNDRYFRASPVPYQHTLNVTAVCAARAAPVGLPDSAHSFDGNQPLTIIQSSGTTGKPKRLVLTQRQFWSRLWSHADALQLTANDRFLQVPGLTWVTGYRRGLNTLQMGGTLVIDYGANIDECLAQLEIRNITFAFLSPAHLQRLVSLSRGDGLRLPDLKLVASGASMTMDQHTFTRQHITPNLYNLYGANEVSALIVATPRDHDKYPDSAGRILGNIEGQIVDENHHPMPPMEIGQIRFRGPDFPSEYLDDPEATARHFRDGWFYPGDYAAINEEGYVFLMGRTDDAINCGGSMFYPAEIERVLVSHPAVAEAAVFGCPHPAFGTVPVAAVVVREFVTREALDKICKKQLQKVKRPRRIEIVPELPRSPQGKLLKTKLVETLCPD